MLQIDLFQALESRQTPYYYYDMGLLEQTVNHVRALSERCGITVHYAVKACNEARVLDVIRRAGLGVDCVSGWEVKACIEAGFPAEKVIFSGVGKSDAEIEYSLKVGIGYFNVESLEELSVLDELAGKLGKQAVVTLRINPNVDAHTHKYITTGTEDNKFGISDYQFESLFTLLKNSNNICFKGLHVHVGSQITDVDGVFSLTCQKLDAIVARFEAAGLHVENVDLGGGLGVDYEDPDSHLIPDFEKWFKTIEENLTCKQGRTVHVEPGRAIVAQCSSLITKVLYVKSTRTKEFVVVDAGMTDLIRPALYGSYHKIENLSAFYARGEQEKEKVYDVVGPICESSDVFAQDRRMRQSQRGDLLAIRTAGAYGSVMASRYNLRPLAPAVFSDDLK